MTASVASLAYALKSLWPQERVKNEVYPDHPFLAMISKTEDFYGDGIYIAVRTGDPQGRSAAFGTAQTISAASSALGNAGAQRGVRFYIQRVQDYQVVNLTTEAILAAKRDEGALIRSLDTEMKAGVNNIGKSLATALFRGQTGAIGAIGAITKGATSNVTLANINDVTSFEIGMQIVAAATAAGALRANTGSPAVYARVTGVNRDSGLITFTSADINAGTDWAVNDTLFSNGDAQNGASAGLKVSGLADWVPSTTPTSTLFNGVDRSVDPTRLGGLRIDISAFMPEEGLITVLSKQAREGGRPSHLFCNHADYRNIMLSLGSKVENEYVAVGDIGFEALKVRGPKGVVAVVADQDCPAGSGWSLDMSSWKLASLEGCPQILDMDGAQLSRVYNADQFEARIAYFANTWCDAPGYNAFVTMPT